MQCLLVNFSNNFCGIACGNRIRRDIFRHQRIRSDDGIFAYRYVAHDSGSGSDGCAFFNYCWPDDPVGLALWLPSAIRCPGVFVIDEGYVVADENIVLYRYTFANEAIKHLQALEPATTYEGNLKVITNSEYFDYKFTGYMTSVISFYQRFLDKREYKARKAIERSKMPISCYCSTIGKREDFTLTVTKSLGFEGYYGITYINLMKDSKGNVFTWSTGKSLNEGSTYLIKGTVKEHSEYKDTKQTTITRCKVLKKYD